MRTLAILAHQDDETISCGGLIAKRARMGHEVYVFALYGRKYNYGHGDQHVGEQFAAYLEACRVLRVKDCRAFRWEEGEPHKRSHYEMLQHIETALTHLKPHEVIVHHAADVNQDHRYLADICRIALRPSNLGNVDRILACHALDGTVYPDGNYYETLGTGDLRDKQLAMACYKRELRDAPNLRNPEGLQLIARVTGARAGVDLAEAYTLLFQRS